MRKFGIVFVILIGGLFLSLGFTYLSSSQHQEAVQQQSQPIQVMNQVEENQLAQADLERVRDLLAIKEGRQAIEIIKRNKAELNPGTKTGRIWIDYAIEANDQIDDIHQLHSFFRYSPHAFVDHEKASLKLAHSALNQRDLLLFQEVRGVMRGQERDRAAWLFLDCDSCLLEGKSDQAISMLQSTKLNGQHDTNRLVRLAMLTRDDKPQIAWDALVQAKIQDRHNPDLLSLTGNFLESQNRQEDALDDYLEAYSLAPERADVADQLADQYVKLGKYPEALSIWKNFLTPEGPQHIWLKAYFWSHVASPIPFNWKRAKLPEGELKPLLQYLVQLEPGRFWNEERFELVANSRQYLSTIQETYWLRLLQDLKDRDYQNAWNLLKYNPFTDHSYQPDLERALKQIFIYQKRAKQSDTVGPIAVSVNNDKHEFFRALDAHETTPIIEIPEQVRALLKNREVFSYAFVCAGWLDAGLSLHTVEVLPSNFPRYVAVELAEAMAMNQDPEDALEFAERQPASPELDLLIGELLIAEGQPQDGIQYLQPLTRLGTDVGYQASLILSGLYIKNGELELARETIKSVPALAQNVDGKEKLARIAHLEGNERKAVKLYQSIVYESSEAKSFLARKAFLDKDWDTARELTEQLLEEHPGNTTLIDNLRKIRQNQQSERG